MARTWSGTPAARERLLVTEDAEEQGAEPAVLGCQQQVLGRHRAVGEPVRDRPCGGGVEAVADLVRLA